MKNLLLAVLLYSLLSAATGYASAITVLSAMPVSKPVDPAYAPYAYFTQSNFSRPKS